VKILCPAGDDPVAREDRATGSWKSREAGSVTGRIGCGPPPRPPPRVALPEQLVMGVQRYGR